MDDTSARADADRLTAALARRFGEDFQADPALGAGLTDLAAHGGAQGGAALCGKTGR